MIAIILYHIISFDTAPHNVQPYRNMQQQKKNRKYDKNQSPWSAQHIS